MLLGDVRVIQIAACYEPVVHWRGTVILCAHEVVQPVLVPRQLSSAQVLVAQKKLINLGSHMTYFAMSKIIEGCDPSDHS